MSDVIVDTSLYIQWLRQRADFLSLLRPWLAQGRLLVCGVIRVEVLRGVLDPRQRDNVMEVFQLASEVQLTPSFWGEVADMAWTLDRRGMVIPTPDLAIAHCAMKHDATLVALDDHFRHIPGLKRQKNLPAFR